MPRRNGYLLGLMVFMVTIPHVTNRPSGLHFHIKEVATRYDVSEDLIAAIIEIESQFNPRAVSRRGGRGLMQLMPATAARLGVGDPFDPRENIEGGVRHLRRLLDRFARVRDPYPTGTRVCTPRSGGRHEPQPLDLVAPQTFGTVAIALYAQGR